MELEKLVWRNGLVVHGSHSGESTDELTMVVSDARDEALLMFGAEQSESIHRERFSVGQFVRHPGRC